MEAELTHSLLTLHGGHERVARRPLVLDGGARDGLARVLVHAPAVARRVVALQFLVAAVIRALRDVQHRAGGALLLDHRLPVRQAVRHCEPGGSLSATLRAECLIEERAATGVSLRYMAAYLDPLVVALSPHEDEALSAFTEAEMRVQERADNEESR